MNDAVWLLTFLKGVLEMDDREFVKKTEETIKQFERRLSKIESILEKRAGHNISDRLTEKKLPEEVGVAQLFHCYKNFVMMVGKMVDQKDFSHLALVVSATFPEGNFFTNRALAERMSKIARMNITNYFIMRITAQFKSSYRDVYKGGESKRVKIDRLMEGLFIKWNDTNFMKGLIDQDVTPSKRRRIQMAFRLNELGRKKVFEIAKSFNCENEVKNISEVGLPGLL